MFQEYQNQPAATGFPVSWLTDRMLNLIAGLPAGSRVLDLGAATGSFKTARTDLQVVRLDLDSPRSAGPAGYVLADAARMPFRTGAFDLIVSNHSLEHFPDLASTLQEIRRTLKPDGALYVAVPDATTFTDRLYRWMARGGGHVNAFESPSDVIGPVERATGLALRSTGTLYTSLSFLNSHNFTAPPPRKIALFAGGSEGFLAAFTWMLRWIDRHFGSRLSVYGWAFYFGNVDLPETLEPWINVCVRCGAGLSETWLGATGAVGPSPGAFARYRCPNCGGWNRLTRERE